MSRKTKTSNSLAKRARGRPTQVETEDISRLLLEFALKEFLEHGYGGASISRIVREAGISKTTMYSRYSSKEALFRAIIDWQVDNLSPANLLLEEGKRLDLADGLKRYACHMLDVSMKADLLGVNRLMLSESHRFPELGEAMAMRTQMGVKRITGFIEDWADQKGIECQNPRAIAEVFILSIRGWYTDVMLTNRNVSKKERDRWVDQTIEVLLTSIG